MDTRISHQRHQCGTCFRAFSRLEHLQRHAKTHLEDKPFQCRFCRQAFSRKDAVRRHEQTRHVPDGDGEPQPKMRRACAGCGAARVSCPGGLPCVNCESKGQQCVYVPRKRKRIGPDQEPSSSHSHLEYHQTSHSDRGDGSNNLATWMPGEGVESLQTGEAAEAVRPNSSYHDHSVIEHSLETAMNWLPFDYNFANAPRDNLSPEGHRSQSNGAAVSSLAEATSPELEGRSSPRNDSLASLIASMGRASQPFGNRFSSRAMSGSDAANPVGSLYSDGAGGRTSQAERAMQIQRAQREASLLAISAGSIATPGSECSWMQALENGLNATSPSENGRLYRIPDQIYSEVKAKVDARVPFCLSSSSFFLSGRSFPSKEILDNFVRLYFDHFHPVCPFIDLPLLNMPIWGWSLCLATAAIGCRYSSSAQKDICADALSVVLRETLVYEVCLTPTLHTNSRRSHLSPLASIRPSRVYFIIRPGATSEYAEFVPERRHQCHGYGRGGHQLRYELVQALLPLPGARRPN